MHYTSPEPQGKGDRPSMLCKMKSYARVKSTGTDRFWTITEPLRAKNKSNQKKGPSSPFTLRTELKSSGGNEVE